MSTTTPFRLSFGKHKGELITDIPSSYLQWGCENLNVGSMRNAFLNEAARRTQSPDLRKQERRANRLLNSTDGYYAWTDRKRRVHLIPNDVIMDGSEDEACPFDVTPEQYTESLSDLDREFRAIVG